MRAVEMYAEGGSYKGIAREIGCSPNTIKGWILGFKETQLKNE
jgi:transposase-like protein